MKIDTDILKFFTAVIVGSLVLAMGFAAVAMIPVLIVDVIASLLP